MTVRVISTKKKTSIFIFALVSVYSALHKVTAFVFVGSIRFSFMFAYTISLLTVMRRGQLLTYWEEPHSVSMPCRKRTWEKFVTYSCNRSGSTSTCVAFSMDPLLSNIG